MMMMIIIIFFFFVFSLLVFFKCYYYSFQSCKKINMCYIVCTRRNEAAEHDDDNNSKWTQNTRITHSLKTSKTGEWNSQEKKNRLKRYDDGDVRLRNKNSCFLYLFLKREKKLWSGVKCHVGRYGLSFWNGFAALARNFFFSVLDLLSQL